MRKTKEVKRMRREAGQEYKKGKRTEAYKMWAEAKTEMDVLRAPKKPAKQASSGESAPA